MESDAVFAIMVGLFVLGLVLVVSIVVTNAMLIREVRRRGDALIAKSLRELDPKFESEVTTTTFRPSFDPTTYE